MAAGLAASAAAHGSAYSRVLIPVLIHGKRDRLRCWGVRSTTLLWSEPPPLQGQVAPGLRTLLALQPLPERGFQCCGGEETSDCFGGRGGHSVPLSPFAVAPDSCVEVSRLLQQMGPWPEDTVLGCPALGGSSSGLCAALILPVA